MASFPPILDTIVKDSVAEMTGATAGMEAYKVATTILGDQGEVAIAVASVIGFTGD